MTILAILVLLAQAATSARPGVEFYWSALLARGTGAQAVFEQLGDGIVEASGGDRLQFYLSPRSDAHVYLVHQDVDGSVERLLPTSASALLAGGTQTYLPSKGQWYGLDAKTGRELIVLLVSLTKLDALEARLREAENSTAASRSAATKAVIDEIGRLRAEAGSPENRSARPLAIAGRFRSTAPDPAAIAERMTAERFLARTYIIERK